VVSNPARPSFVFIFSVLFLFVMGLIPASEGKFEYGPFAEAYIGLESGDFEFENNLDEGDYDAFSLGARLGLGMGAFFLGGEMNYLIMGSDSTLESSTRNNDTSPLLDGTMESYGATLGLSLGKLRLWGSYLPYIKASEDVTAASTAKYEYQYLGQGFKAGLGLNVFKDFVVNLEYIERVFDQYRIEDGVPNTVNTPKTDRAIDLETSSFLLSIGWRFDIGEHFK
jgi:hypothetical protein